MMGIIGKRWNKRIMPERLNIGVTKTGRIVLIHWTKKTENGETYYCGVTK